MSERNPSREFVKHFIPLESNPEVFTELIQKLGAPNTSGTPALQFEDIYTLEDREALRLQCRPAHALILVLPTTEGYDKRVEEEDAKLSEYDDAGEREDVVFFSQTINNACGLYAILHALFNGDARTKLGSNNTLTTILNNGTPLKPKERALVLERNEQLEEAYKSVASKGDTEAPDNPELEVDYHYICLVKSHRNGHFYQMDGMRKCPLDLGPLGADEDILSDKCIDVIQSLIASEQGADLGFSLMALVSR